MMNITFEPNNGPNSGTIPYFMNVEIGASELEWEQKFRVPVLQPQGLTYVIEACGMRVKADTLRELGPQAQSLLINLQNMSRMPTYVFIAQRSRKMFPIYTVGNKVVAVTPQGLMFRHVELAKVREYLKDYLQQIGILGPRERGDRLHVRGVDQERLSLIRPGFYLKKRPVAAVEHEFWAPVFPVQETRSIYTYAASKQHEVAVDEGQEVFMLRHQVAEALIADKRLTTNYNLRIDRLLPDYWARVRNNLTALPETIVYEGVKLPLYQAGSMTVALEYRSAEDRYSLFFGSDLTDLMARISQNLIKRGIIGSVNALTIQAT
ncbi:MAG: hypothetical protein R3264_18700 [Anaerolineae bacterium]|nr:hypothetical protein [Anaerolineae bacterium]